MSNENAQEDDNGLSQGQQDTSNFQSLPEELQMMVFNEAMSKDSIHFAKLSFRFINHNSRWMVVMKQTGKPLDDSAFKHHETIRRTSKLAQQCAEKSSYRALTILLHDSPTTKHVIDGSNDLLCLGILPSITEDSNGPRYYSWFPDQSQSFPTLDFQQMDLNFRGLQKIGSVREIISDSAREYDTCRPDATAWFLDCCPDIEEFYLILPPNISSRIQHKCINHHEQTGAGVEKLKSAARGLGEWNGRGILL